ncbi:hypothetical protein WAX88_05640 [Photobacterium damselae subsp. damselae]|uniref:hypothetical protein n=1 Tax=Photobacterium damselae TaxID=38293 RepID=UPI000D0798B7|nr:hypothetical protein [Photobacterium damselae]PSB81990.1 hypothetical protein C5F61_00930 [Photobacterium damselae subsp. damselae]
MLKPIKKELKDTKSSHCEITRVELLREVGSLDEHRRALLLDQDFQQSAEARLDGIREQMRQHEQSRLVSQEEALIEKSEKERKRREQIEQLGGLNE